MKLNTQFRSGTVVRQPEDNGEEGQRTITLSFSSEEPYERWWGIEVLGHGPEDMVRLDRLNNAAPLLKDHRATIDSQVGRVTRAWVEDGRGMAEIAIDETDAGEDVWQRLQRGELSKISVGYDIYAVEETFGEGNASDTYRVTDWEPMEVSVVAIPADDTVGYGRQWDSKGHEVETRGVRDMPPDNNPAPQPEHQPLNRAAIAEQERQRVAELLTFGELHAEVGGRELAAEVVKQGGNLEKLKDDIIAATQKAYDDRTSELAAQNRLPTASEGQLDLSVSDVTRFSIARLARARAEPDNRRVQEEAAYELDVTGTWGRHLLDRGIKPRRSGINIPPDVLVDPRALHRQRLIRTLYTTAASADELVGTDHRGDLLVPFLWNMSAFLPYVMTADDLVGNVDIPREATEITASWVEQTAAVSEDDPTFDTITLTPRQLACMTIYGRTLLNQSSPTVDGIILRQAGMAMALGEDAAIVNGRGSAQNEPEGVLVASGTAEIPGGTSWTNGKDLNWADTVQFETEVANQNALFEDSMYFFNPATIGKLKSTPKVANEPMYIYNDMAGATPVNGRMVRGSNQIPRNLTRGTETNTSAAIFGSPSQILCAHWSGVDLVVDPYTRGEYGEVRMIFYRDLDVGVLQPKAFSVAKNGIITT